MPKKAKPCFQHGQKPRQSRVGNDVSAAQRKERLAAVIEKKSKAWRRVRQNQVPACPVLHECKTQDEARCPKSEQEDQRERPEVAKRGFAAALRFDPPGDPRPRALGQPVVPGRQSEQSAYPPRQDHGLKSVQQDSPEDQQPGKNGNDAQDKHERC